MYKLRVSETKAGVTIEIERDGPPSSNRPGPTPALRLVPPVEDEQEMRKCRTVELRDRRSA